MKSKKWYQTKTIWVNLVALVVSVTAAFGFDLGVDEAMQATIVVGIMSVVNIILRLVTGVPVKK